MADPGLVDTQISRDWPPALRAAYRWPLRACGLMRPPHAGAAAVLAAVNAAAADGAGSSLVYCYGPLGARLASRTTDASAAAGAWLWGRAHSLVLSDDQCNKNKNK